MAEMTRAIPADQQLSWRGPAYLPDLRDLLAIERSALLSATGDFRKLRRRYLRTFKRTRRWSRLEAWWPHHERLRKERQDEWQALQIEIGKLAEWFNLAAWLVERLLALPAGEALDMPFPYSAWCARPQLVLTADDLIRTDLLSCYQAGFAVTSSPETLLATSGLMLPCAIVRLDLTWPAKPASLTGRRRSDPYERPRCRMGLVPSVLLFRMV